VRRDRWVDAAERLGRSTKVPLSRWTRLVRIGTNTEHMAEELLMSLNSSKRAAVTKVKECFALSHLNPTGRRPPTPRRTLAFVEIKTVWHLIGL